MQRQLKAVAVGWKSEKEAMKGIVVQPSDGMNLVLPSTGTGQAKDLGENVGVTVGELRDYTEPSKKKACAARKMTKNRQVQVDF